MTNIPTLLLGVVETLLFDGVDFGFGWTTSVGFKAKICSTSIFKTKKIGPKINLVTYFCIYGGKKRWQEIIIPLGLVHPPSAIWPP